jgi:hypothetical protein
MVAKLGAFTLVSLREVWDDEATSFTPWLAQEENLAKLSEALGLDLVFERTEARVGAYKADILARDGETDKLVIIENQLERTNHDHLGKILTYASGLGATTVIWIAAEITDEHRQALTWLNEATKDEYSFFGVQIELWQIDDSLPAPRFNVVVSPNDWSRAVRETVDTPVSDIKGLQLEFWSGFRQYVQENSRILQARKAQPQHWYEMQIGRSGFHISCTVNTREQRAGCEVYINHQQSKRAFELLSKQKQVIETEFGEQLDWQPLPSKHACRIALYRDADVTNQDTWPGLYAWFTQKSETFHRAFSMRIKSLDLGPEAIREPK